MSLKNRKLGRTTDQRKAMLRAMVTYLLENGQIKTTLTRAKEVAPVAEKMITLAKDNTLVSYRQALGFITKEDVANKLFKEIGPKYADRNGGYTRIVRIGPRRGDAAEMAIIQLVQFCASKPVPLGTGFFLPSPPSVRTGHLPRRGRQEKTFLAPPVGELARRSRD